VNATTRQLNGKVFIFPQNPETVTEATYL